MNIRFLTCLIVEKNQLYLSGRSVLTREYTWSDSPWDAWRTRNPKKAQSMAQRADGELMLFNPVVGQLAPLNQSR